MKPLTHMFGWLGLVGWRYKRGYDVTAGSSKRWVVSRVVVVVRSTRSPAMAAVWCRYEFLLGNTPQDVSIQLQQCTKGDPHAYFCQDAAQCPHGVYNPSATNFQVEVDTDYGSGSVLLPSASGRCEPRFAPVGYRLVFSPRCANERCPRLLVCCCPRGRWQLHVRVLPIHSSRRRRPSDLLQPSSCGAYPIIVGGCAGKLSDVRGSQVSTRYNNARVEWESPELVVNERVRNTMARPLHAGQVTVVVVYTPSHRSPAGHHSLSNIPRVRHPSE